MTGNKAAGGIPWPNCEHLYYQTWLRAVAAHAATEVALQMTSETAAEMLRVP